MILVDTGPIVALFDPRDDLHDRAEGILATLRRPLVTTIPVLTEVFHLLDPASRGATAVRQFVSARGLGVWFLNETALRRAFELMRRYADHPMDLADASLVVAAETLKTTRVFTLDRNDFAAYRPVLGRTSRRFSVLG